MEIEQSTPEMVRVTCPFATLERERAAPGGQEKVMDGPGVRVLSVEVEWRRVVRVEATVRVWEVTVVT